MNIRDHPFLYQWDTNRYLDIPEADAVYVDFARTGEEPLRIAVADGGVSIPDSWLQTAGNQNIYVCYVDGTLRGYTLRIAPRPKPPDYVATPDEAQTYAKLEKKVSDEVSRLDDRINNIPEGKDGITPTIGDNGNWYLGDTDTGKPSRGEDGLDGSPGADGKSAYQYAQEGGYTGTEAEFAAKLAAEMPTVPTNVSAFANDVGYLTKHQDISGKIDKPASGVVGQVLAVKTVDENGKPTEFACVYQTSGEGSGSEGEVVETTFKVWGPDATGASDGDVVTELNSGYYDKNGKQVATSAFGCTVPLIEINEDATIYAYNLYDFEAGYAITFFDSSKAVISGVGGTGNTSTRITGNQTVPSGAKYVAVTLLKADPGMYCQITTRETVVTDSLGTRVGFIEADVATLETQVSELANAFDSASNETETLDYNALASSITRGYYDTNGALQSTALWRCTNFIPVSEGDKLTVKLTTYNTAMAIAYFNENKEFISGVVGDTWSWSTSVYPLSGEQDVPSGAYFMRVSVFIGDFATEQYVTINRAIIKNIQNRLDIINGKPLNILVLGDSYSAMGRWVDGMKEVINIKNLVNLGVSSATLKDRYADRTTYPYSSRPDKADGSGNTNTLSSQIQKLKRLMAGTDLDSGESQIYASKTDYPDVIIIEGGMNDAPDSDEVAATYYNQFMTSKTAYYKLNSSAAVTQTTVWVKPAIDTIDRTCFAGAYRYLCEELLALFPNAQIFLTTVSHMNYFTVDPNDRYGKIAEQQRKCADIMSYTVIDWHAEGNLNTMMIGLNGSGTESDPYTPVGGNEYTTDLLHPNDKGGKRYGRLAGKVIAQKYLGF